MDESPDMEDNSVELAKAALKSPSKSQEATHATPTTRAASKTPSLPQETARTTRSKAQSAQRSATPAPGEDASQPIPSSSPKSLEDGKDSLASTKAALSKLLKTDAADLLSLKMLRYHPSQNVNVAGVATNKPPEPRRAKGGPRGSLLEFNIADAAIGPAQVVTVRIFRAHKEALPIVAPGDVVILHQFAITAMKGRGFGLQATEASSWAVYERRGSIGPRDDDGNVVAEQPQIRGPPIEVSEGEVAYVDLLREWYGLLDEKAMTKLEKANQKALEA
jgi:hypothetical protein